MEKNCLHCGVAFPKPYFESVFAWNFRHKFCSRKCSVLAKIGGRHTEEHKRKIGMKSLGRKHRIESVMKMQGENCHRWKGGKAKCQDCGKITSRYDVKYCRVCEKSHRKGPEASHWKGGITAISHSIRNSEKYKQWRGACLTRDNYKCVECGSIKKLEVDHIFPFSLIMFTHKISTFYEAMNCDPLWDTENGRALCHHCHEKTDSFKWKATSMKKKMISTGEIS